MRTIGWTIALGLASAAPALAAPGWHGGEGRNDKTGNGQEWNNEGWNEAKKFSGWGESSPFKPGFNKPGSPSSWGPTWSGTCGGEEGKSCDGSWAGQCCSKDGRCGSTNLHCGEGCQPEFGKCAPGQESSSIIAPVPSSYAPSSYSSIESSLSSEASSAAASASITPTDTNTASHTISIPIPSSFTHSSHRSGNFSTSRKGNFSTTASISGSIAKSQSQQSVSTTATGSSSTLSSGSAGGSVVSSASSHLSSGSSIWTSATAVPIKSSAASSSAVSAGSSLLSSVGSESGVSAGSSIWSTVVTTITESFSQSVGASGSSSPSSPSGSSAGLSVSTITSTFTVSLPGSSASASKGSSAGASVGSSAVSSGSAGAPKGSSTGVSIGSASASGGSSTGASVGSSTASAGSSTASTGFSTASTGSSTASAGSSSWTGSVVTSAGSPSGYSGSASGSSSPGSLTSKSAGSVTTVLSGISSSIGVSITGFPSGNASVRTSTIAVSTKTYPSLSLPYGGNTSMSAGISVVTSPTISISFNGSITTSIPITTPTLLPNITTSLNTTKPSNTTSACTTKPTPMCIPCEGAPDPTAPWCGYDINTDFYKYVPRTCKTVEYDFVVTNTTIAPDGVSRMGLLVNGQMPGPAIEANWGDTVVVRLTNNLPADSTNGTTLHFHGLRQNYTNEMDGVPSITQCPLAPGESMTYKWVATQYGTSWYHSHFQLQAWEGIMGPIVINGPSSADYDVDMGPIILQDWSHQTVDEMYDAAQDGQTGGPRVLDTGLINGLNVFGADGSGNQTGKRYQLEFTPGKKHLLRVVNTAIQSTFKFYIDGHKLQVISTDFVPIKPYYTNILNINIGQRYDVIVEANQAVGDYWMRSDNQDACAVITNAKNIKAVVHYTGGPGSIPTSMGYNYTSECVDEPLSSLVPVVPFTVGSSNTEYDETVVVSANNSLNLYRWYLYGTTGATPETFQSEWSDPTLYEIWKNNTVPPYSGGLALKIPKLQEWVYVVIESPIPLPHPIHLHGHDFYVLGSGSGTYDSGSSAALNLNNPPRRDVALLPTAGYLVLAFQTDNPGVWLMHCHIGWHTSMGFSMQIVEAQDLIKPSIDDTCLLDDTCKSWRKYANARDLTTPDSGV